MLVAAGLVARKARAKGLSPKPWVKTSLAPGSQVVTDYLTKAGLTADLDAIGFNLVGYGCTTCIGNSGPLAPELSAAINENDLVAALVLSGNRNFEGRVSPDVRANFLASPPLVVAYALKGTVTEDMVETPIGQDQDGADVFLKDIWPTNQEVAETMAANIDRGMFEARYGNVYAGDAKWREIDVARVGHLHVARGQHLHRQPALFRGHDDDPGARRRHHRRAPAGDPGRLDHDRPHQPRGHRSRRTRRPAPSCRSIRSAAPTSTATARGAATTKS